VSKFDFGSEISPQSFTTGEEVTTRRLDQQRADQRATDIAPIIGEIEEALRQAKRPITLKAIADCLNARQVPTARDRGHWFPMQVKRLLERMP
jgi:hypothetical protein